MRNPFFARLRARCRACGFTLVELMITLAVAAILAMIAVPSFKHVMVSTNLSNINNDLAGDLVFARSEAVSKQVSVAVAASAGNWHNGWVVQIPPASSTGTATVLRVHPSVPDNYVVNTGGPTEVLYRPQGMIDATAGACFTISAISNANNQPRFLQVLPAGMLQQTTSDTPPTNPTCASP